MRWGRRERARLRLLADARGLSIVETMFAITILAVGFLGLAGVQGIASRAQTLGKNESIAMHMANRDLEQMRRSTFAEVHDLTSSSTAEGVSFGVTRTVTTVGSNKRVEVVAAWTDRFGSHTVRLATVVSSVTNP